MEHVPSRKKAETIAHHCETLGVKKGLKAFSDLYDKLNQPMLESDPTVLKAKIQVLADLHLFVNGISPLDTSQLGFQSKDVSEEVEDMLYNQPNCDVNILSNSLRVTMLTDMYQHLDICYLKAKAAYALGLNALECQFHQDAERIFFESIYILDVCEPLALGMPPIVSQLGTNCLLQYAEVLLYNYKYKYAVEAFHAASQNLQRRIRTRDYIQLLEKMASICKENDDAKRAVSYYRELLQIYLQSDRINEVFSLLFLLSFSC